MFARDICFGKFETKKLDKLCYHSSDGDLEIIDFASHNGYQFHARAVGGPMLSKKLIDGGLLILSRFPIIERDSFVYSKVTLFYYFLNIQIG
jgi:hypothetical protein